MKMFDSESLIIKNSQLKEQLSNIKFLLEETDELYNDLSSDIKKLLIIDNEFCEESNLNLSKNRLKKIDKEIGLILNKLK